MNIFSYQYGSLFTGKEIKEFLRERQRKGKSLYNLEQYLNCQDEVIYRFVELPGTGVGEKLKGFIKVI